MAALKLFFIPLSEKLEGNVIFFQGGMRGWCKYRKLAQSVTLQAGFLSSIHLLRYKPLRIKIIH